MMAATKHIQETHQQKKINTTIQEGKKKQMPSGMEPMMCSLSKQAFTDDDWLYELKFDGYRIMAFVNKKKRILQSRSGLDYTKKYTLITEALKELKHEVIIDGEIVVPDENGHPDFDKLQKYKNGDQIIYYVFDILWIDGYDITDLDLIKRKEILEYILPENPHLKFTEHFDDGLALYKQVEELELEGIVAKRRSAQYQPGKRSKDWLKIPTEIRQEFVIGGWTESESGKLFRSLLFGAYEKNKLMFIGHAGLGFRDKQRRILFQMR